MTTLTPVVSSPPARYEETTYTVRRKVLKLFGGAFHIFDSAGRIAFFCELKAFKLKEDIRVYTDEGKGTELLSIKARQILDFSAAYDVVDSTTQQKVGALKRRGWRSSLVRDEWILMDAADQEIGRITEDSAVKALLRRYVEIMALLFPQRYTGQVGGQTVCTFRQNFNPFVLKVTLDFSMDPQARLDRRLAIASALLLCAIEGRQK